MNETAQRCGFPLPFHYEQTTIARIPLSTGFPVLAATISFCGLDLKAQEAALRLGLDIVIATPGRLIDHLHNSPNFSLADIERTECWTSSLRNK
uniref:DEAD/DEAH box helicase domain-containing protein n=1 Tax=Globodera rostochiensis TaxID=31243 RepID=A0A914I5Q0_GLORO